MDASQYTQIPNDFFKYHLADLGYAELKVVLVIYRNTFGYHKDTFRLSIRELAKAAGISARNADLATQAAARRGLITRSNTGGVTQWGVVVATTESVVAGDTVWSQGIQSVVAGDTPSIKENIKEKRLRAHKVKTSAAESVDQYPMMQALADVCGVNLKLNKDKFSKHAKDFNAAGLSPEQIKTAYLGDKSWWTLQDWRGKKGQRPTIASIRETVEQATAMPPKLVIR